jgi:hypothetical protein
MNGFIFHLPSEIVQDIIYYIPFNDHSTPPSLENFEYDEHSSLIDGRARYITDYAKTKIASASFTEGMLAVHDCRGNDARFHKKLHATFCEQQCSRNTLLSMSLTCRYFHKLVEPILWRTVELPNAEDKRRAPAQNLLLSLLHRPELGRFVKTLSLKRMELGLNYPYNNRTSYFASNSDRNTDLAKSREKLSRLTFPGVRNKADGKTITGWIDLTHILTLLSSIPSLKALKLVIPCRQWVLEVFRPPLTVAQASCIPRCKT